MCRRAESGRLEAMARQVSVVLDDGTEHKAIVRTVVPEENALTRTRQCSLHAALLGVAQGHSRSTSRRPCWC